MSLTQDLIENISKPQKLIFQGKIVYAVNIELIEPVISKNWQLIVDRENYSLIGLKFVHSEASVQQDEMILFKGKYTWNGITIPRFRHWYEVESGKYLGSDIVVRPLK